MSPVLHACAILALTLGSSPAPAQTAPDHLVPVQLFGALSIDKVPRLRRSAEAGSAEAQFMLYESYRRKARGDAPPWQGDDTLASRAEAVAALRKAAAQRHPEAVVALAAGLLFGDTMAADAREAQVWLSRLLADAPTESRGLLSHLLAQALLDAEDATPDEIAQSLALSDQALALGRADAIATKARALAGRDPAAARAALEAALPSNPLAGLPLARMLLKGEGGPPDRARAERLLAALKDNRDALAERGRQHLPGGAFPRMPLRAITLMAPLAATDVAIRQTLARQLLTYRANLPNADVLFYKLQEDADTGVTGAALTLALLLKANREGFRNEKLWFEHVRRQARSDPRIDVLQAGITARFALFGTTEANKELFTRQTTEAIARLEAQGIAEAFTLHGNLLSKGIVYRQDDVAALAAWRRAAELGDPEGMVAYGDALEDGRGTDKDRSGALVWFRKAAAAGSVEGRGKVVTRFRFDSFDRQISLREGISEQVALYGDGLAGPALTAFAGFFSSPRLWDFNDADVASAILDGFRISPAAVDEDRLVPLVKQVPQKYWVLIEQLMVENALMQGPAQGFMGPQARDALRQWVYAVGPLPDTR